MRVVYWVERFAQSFSLWVSSASLLALVYPPLFSWFITGRVGLGALAYHFEGGFVTPGLQLIMLAMGLTLTPGDLRVVSLRRRDVFLGVLLQFTVMPLMGYLAARLFQLPPALATGLVLVCCCPGGTASNVIAFLAKADVALSVAMTTVSTLLAAVCTPVLTTIIVNQNVKVDAVGLYLTTAQVVLIPVFLGLLARKFFTSTVERILAFLPALAVLAIVLIVAGIIAVQRDNVITSGLSVLAAVTVAHGCAFLLGYLASRRLGAPSAVARTTAIEVGMQNSGLGVVLARASFGDPLVAVAPAISAVVHCLYGSALASLWGREKKN